MDNNTFYIIHGLRGGLELSFSGTLSYPMWRQVSFNGSTTGKLYYQKSWMLSELEILQTALETDLLLGLNIGSYLPSTIYYKEYNLVRPADKKQSWIEELSEEEQKYLLVMVSKLHLPTLEKYESLVHVLNAICSRMIIL